MSYQSDINNNWVPIGARDVLAVLKELDSKAVAGTGNVKTSDPLDAEVARGQFDNNLKVKVNGTYYDLKNAQGSGDNKHLYSKNYTRS